MIIATMNDRHSLTMKTTSDGPAEMIRLVNTLLDQRQVSDQANYLVNLVLEEILTNICKFGFDDDRAHDVELRLGFASEEISMEFEDGGREFDPLSVPPPPLDETLLDMEPGGRGIHLVRSMARSVQYRRERNKNILTVTVSNRDA